MKTLTKRLLLNLGLPADHQLGKSWDDKFKPEHHLRAHAALGSLEMDVFMGKDDEKAVRTATLLLRGVNRMKWSDA